jgi:hypothetical protein
MKSGIYARFGSENKDLITEATAQEFRDWFAVKGLNLSFMSDDSLNGLFLDERKPFLQWELRTAFVADAERQGITIYKNKEEWAAFLKELAKKAKEHYG